MNAHDNQNQKLEQDMLSTEHVASELLTLTQTLLYISLPAIKTDISAGWPTLQITSCSPEEVQCPKKPVTTLMVQHNVVSIRAGTH